MTASTPVTEHGDNGQADGNRPRRVLVAKPRGYCAGVDRAVVTVEKALEKYGAPVYVRKEIVHNRYVVDRLSERGAIFVDETDEVPEGALVVFSAHGISPEVRDQAVDRQLRTIDATCPLVTKVHQEVKRFAREDYDILLIGHAGHEEVDGTTGEAPERVQLVDKAEDVAQVEVRDPSKVVWLSQTTLSVDETMERVNQLREKFPTLQSPPSDDICYATQNRQVAVKAMAPECDLVLVVGSQNSSNSKRLVEVALQSGARSSYLIDYATGPLEPGPVQRSGLVQSRVVVGGEQAGLPDPPAQPIGEPVDPEPDRQCALAPRSSHGPDVVLPGQLDQDPANRRPEVGVLMGIQMRDGDAGGPDPLQLGGELPSNVVRIQPAEQAAQDHASDRTAAARRGRPPGWGSRGRSAAVDPPRRWPDAHRRRGRGCPAASARHRRRTGRPPAATSR